MQQGVPLLKHGLKEASPLCFLLFPSGWVTAAQLREWDSQSAWRRASWSWTTFFPPRWLATAWVLGQECKGYRECWWDILERMGPHLKELAAYWSSSSWESSCLRWKPPANQKPQQSMALLIFLEYGSVPLGNISQITEYQKSTPNPLFWISFFHSSIASKNRILIYSIRLYKTLQYCIKISNILYNIV